MSSFLPAIPEIQEEFLTSSSVAQLTMTVSMLSMGIFALFYGTLADRHGRRPVLLIGVAIAFFGSVACAFAPTIEWAIIGRALQAGGATSGMILTRVIVHDIYGDKRTASMLGYITASMTIAPVIGPVAGGFMIEELNWRYIFYCIAALALVLWLAIAITLPETKPDGLVADERLVPIDDYTALVSNVDVRNYLIFTGLSQSTFMAFLGGVPFLVAVYFDLPASVYGLLILPVPLGFGIGGLLAGRYADKIDHYRLVVMSAWTAVLAVVISLLLVTLVWDSPWAICLPTGFVALAIALGSPAAQTQIMSAAGEHSGSASGLTSFIQLVFGAIVAQFVGWSATFGPIGVVGPMLFCALCAAAVLSLSRRTPTVPAS